MAFVTFPWSAQRSSLLISRFLIDFHIVEIHIGEILLALWKSNVAVDLRKVGIGHFLKTLVNPFRSLGDHLLVWVMRNKVKN